jgi:hypothetical protein
MPLKLAIDSHIGAFTPLSWLMARFSEAEQGKLQRLKILENQRIWLQLKR